ncbi:MAG: ABC transporter substrate-binding protein [Deltaproteobacteria bacterium]
MVKKLFVRRLFTTLLLVIMVPLCCPEQSEASRRHENVLVWGVFTQPTAINPVTTTHSVSAPLIQLIFNSLVRENGKGDYEPDLAASWSISDAGKTYIFHLRKGVRFHDGIELTSRDVLFTFESLIDPRAKAAYSDLFDCVESFSAPDPYTFIVRLKEPYPFFLPKMQRYIMPAHCLATEDIRTCSFNYHPIGTGPFKMVRMGLDRIILEANQDYYEGRPRLGGIVVKVYPDQRAVYTALMRSEIDFVGFMNREDFLTLKDDPSFRVYTVPSTGYYCLSINVNDQDFGDKGMRKALAMAIDRRLLIEKVVDGYGEESSGPFDAYFQDQKIQESNVYDPVAASRILAASGWKDENGDGILEKDGRQLEFRVLADTRNDIYRRILLVVRQQLMEVGVKVRLIPFSDESMLTSRFLVETRPQAMLKLSWSGEDPGQAEREWCSSLRPPEDKIWSYHNHDVDSLFAESLFSVANRKQIFRKINNLIMEDSPVCFLFRPLDFHVVSSQFDNTEGFFNKYMRFYLLKDWQKRERR